MQRLNVRRALLWVGIGCWILCHNPSGISGESQLQIFPQNPKFIALTFDDGPHADYTRELIQVLADHRAKATFFVVGKQVAKFPELTKEISAAGHQIANHTYNHPNLTRLLDEQVVQELEQTRYLVSNLTGQPCQLYRPPGGRFNDVTASAAHQAGYRMILWSIFPQDHIRDNPAQLAKSVISNAFDGGVVLLHSGRPGTIAALPVIITELAAQGYVCVTINELINRDLRSPNLYSFYRSGRTYTN